MNAGETARRVAFNALDKVKGGKLARIKKKNKYCIEHGVTQRYLDFRIGSLIRYAKNHSPYYQGHEEWQQLSDFPSLRKADYIDHYEQVTVDCLNEQGELYKLRTSGSTGTPFTVLCEQDKMDRYNMNYISFMELQGFRVGMKRGEFRAWIPGQNTISRWKSFKNNLIMIDISNMSDDALDEICNTIQKQGIQVLVSYSSALTALTQYLERTCRDLSKWKVEMVFSMGEALPEGTREAIRRIFGFAPIRSYGNNENGFIAMPLNDGEEYIVDMYNFYVEILKMDSDEPVEEGDLGRIVVTDFYNKTMPIIRYDTGDTGKMRTWRDEEGRIHQALTEIYGRRGSLMYNTKGAPLSIHVFMNILLNFEGMVYQAKCIQWGVNDYELLLNVNPDTIDYDLVVGEYKKYLGEDANVRVTVVESIPIQQSGKFMTCENKCEEYLK